VSSTIGPKRPLWVLVCGGRRHAEVTPLREALDTLRRAVFDEMIVVQGGARGADLLAEAWAMRNEIAYAVCPARWKLEGRAAGPKRNQRMLDWFEPDLVIACPGGVGTADMVRRATFARIPVHDLAAGEPLDLSTLSPH
jgi:aspartokinase-like uncharacterized kinase